MRDMILRLDREVNFHLYIYIWFLESVAGKLVEYDEPSKLMEINSSFSKLVAEYWSSFNKN